MKKKKRKQKRKQTDNNNLYDHYDDRRLIREFIATINGCTLPPGHVLSACCTLPGRKFDMITLGLDDLRRLVRAMERSI
jgi:hypothetical protein